MIDQVRERRQELADLAPWIEALQVVRENPAYFPNDPQAAETFRAVLNRWTEVPSLQTIAERAGADAIALETLLPRLPSDKARSRVAMLVDRLREMEVPASAVNMVEMNSCLRSHVAEFER